PRLQRSAPARPPTSGWPQLQRSTPARPPPTSAPAPPQPLAPTRPPTSGPATPQPLAPTRPPPPGPAKPPCAAQPGPCPARPLAGRPRPEAAAPRPARARPRPPCAARVPPCQPGRRQGAARPGRAGPPPPPAPSAPARARAAAHRAPPRVGRARGTRRPAQPATPGPLLARAPRPRPPARPGASARAPTGARRAHTRAGRRAPPAPRALPPERPRGRPARPPARAARAPPPAPRRRRPATPASGLVDRGSPKPLAQRCKRALDLGQRDRARVELLPRPLGVGARGLPLGQRPLQHLLDTATERAAGRGHEVLQPIGELVNRGRELGRQRGRRTLDHLGRALLGLLLDLAVHARLDDHGQDRRRQSQESADEGVDEQEDGGPEGAQREHADVVLERVDLEIDLGVGRTERRCQRLHGLLHVLVGERDDLLGQLLHARANLVALALGPYLERVPDVLVQVAPQIGRVGGLELVGQRALEGGAKLVEVAVRHRLDGLGLGVNAVRVRAQKLRRHLELLVHF